jgi:hypothetical protein
MQKRKCFRCMRNSRSLAPVGKPSLVGVSEEETFSIGVKVLPPVGENYMVVWEEREFNAESQLPAALKAGASG